MTVTTAAPMLIESRSTMNSGHATCGGTGARGAWEEAWDVRGAGIDGEGSGMERKMGAGPGAA